MTISIISFFQYKSSTVGDHIYFVSGVHTRYVGVFSDLHKAEVEFVESSARGLFPRRFEWGTGNHNPPSRSPSRGRERLASQGSVVRSFKNPLGQCVVPYFMLSPPTLPPKKTLAFELSLPPFLIRGGLVRRTRDCL